MSTHIEHLYALVDASAADDAVQRLEAKLPADTVEVRTPEPGSYRLLDERLHEDAIGAGKGFLLGGAVGLVVGAVVVLILGYAPLPAVLTVFGFVALFGMAGGMWGLQRREPEDDDPLRDVVVDDPSACRLVVVLEPHERDWARRVLEKEFGARALESPDPVPEEGPAGEVTEHIGEDEG